MTLENNINPLAGKIIQERPALKPVEYPTAFPKEPEMSPKKYAPLPPPSGRLPALPPSIESSAAALAGKTKVYLAMVDDESSVIESMKLTAQELKDEYVNFDLDITAAKDPVSLIKSLNEKLKTKNADEKPYILLITDGYMNGTTFVDSVNKVSKLARSTNSKLITPILRSGADVEDLRETLSDAKRLDDDNYSPFVEEELADHTDFDIYDTAGLRANISEEIDKENLLEDSYIYTLKKPGNFLFELEDLLSRLDSIIK